MADGAVVIGGGGCCCLVTVCLIIYLCLSFKQVNQTDWCLRYDFWTESVNEEVMIEPGLKFTGMGNYLICYPNTNKYVYFRNFPGRPLGQSVDDDDLYNPPITVRTQDGLTVDLELEFVYKFRSNTLRDLYMLVGEKDAMFNHMTHISTGILDNFATNFTAVEFFNNRSQVSLVFRDQLQTALSQRLFIDVQTLQLQPAHFPREYSEIIDQTQEQRQDIEVATQERQTKLIQKQTALSTATTLAETLTITANGDAQKIAYDNAAQVEQFNIRQAKSAEGYNRALAFFAENPGTATSDFMNYLSVIAFNEHGQGSKTVRLPAVPEASTAAAAAAAGAAPL